MAKSKFGRGFIRVCQRSSALLVAAGALTAAFSGCMDRPVVPSKPKTSNISVQAVPAHGVKKIDLLFVVDNSISMADKQQILGDAVPVLVRRFVQPVCITGDENNPTPVERLPDGSCPAKSAPEFEPINDIHIGVISSSLGDYGSDGCKDAKNGNDKGHLIATVREDVSSWNNTGFLAWGPEGETNVDKIVGDFSNMVVKTGESGCGYEATLESWYRFLVDPAPPLSLTREGDFNKREGIDQTVLDQRAKFLRPDSLVAIIMLSDENDCSIADVPMGHYVTAPNVDRFNRPMTLTRGTSACEKNPNDDCCRPCKSNETAPPKGCTPIEQDPACSPKEHAIENDQQNLRCYQQRKRFGHDFLFPVQRYIDALTKDEVPDREGKLVQNPLFAGTGAKKRNKGLVFLAGIVGVPWQDIADDNSLLKDKPLRFLNAKQLTEQGRWDEILGDPAKGVPPLDPLMVETPFPRTGKKNDQLAARFARVGRPDEKIAIAPESSTSPHDNIINGHEFKVATLDGKPDVQAPKELQYACIFERSSPETCTSDKCDCTASDAAKNSPLCQSPSGTAVANTQYFGKAYPGTRHLEVLRGIGNSGIVASICPKVTRAESEQAKLADGYGYNPAIAAIIDVVKGAFDGGCLNRELIVEEDESSPNFGKVGCAVVEAVVPENGECNCAGGRSPARQELAKAVRSQLSAGGQCSGDDCNDYCMCEVDQLVKEAGQQCQNSESVSDGVAGYCYIDAKKKDADGNPAPIGAPQFAKGCPSGRKLRFVGRDMPVKGSVVYMACAGATTFSEERDGP